MLYKTLYILVPVHWQGIAMAESDCGASKCCWEKSSLVQQASLSTGSMQWNGDHKLWENLL